VRGGVLDHRIVLAASGALLVAAFGDVPANPPQPVDELIADHLELADVGDLRGRPGERLRDRLGDPGFGGVFGIGGKLGLEAGDLVAQGATGSALARPVGDLARKRGGFGLGLAREAAGVEGAGQLAGLDPDLVRRRCGLGGDLLEAWSKGGIGGDEGAGAVLGDDQAFAFESPIKRAGRVDVYPCGSREVAHSRQSIAGRQAAGEDKRSQAPGEAEA
jgi:hypothetical protein